MNYISANLIHNGQRFLEDGSVLVLNPEGQVLDIVSRNTLDPLQIHDYQGILCPGFVNAHCHLELSHLFQQVPEHTGLVDFALHIMKLRNSHQPEEIAAYALDADKTMEQQGIVAVGDICNTDHTLAVKQDSNINYHSFIELISLNPTRAQQVFSDGMSLRDRFHSKGLRASLVPHAPYSVSYELMELIAGEAQYTSIHNQESEAEAHFFGTKTGDFLKLYAAIGLNIDFFSPTGKSSLQSYLPHLAKARHTLLVHNTFTGHDDIRFAEQSTQALYWCLCPNANLYIEKNLPDLMSLHESTIPICLGTDSLASNHGLSILSEINTLQQHYPKIPLETMLRWATANGAAALGLDDRFGTIEKGRRPGINHMVQSSAGYSVHKVY